MLIGNAGTPRKAPQPAPALPEACCAPTPAPGPTHLWRERLPHDHVSINDQHVVLLHVVLGKPVDDGHRLVVCLQGAPARSAECPLASMGSWQRPRSSHGTRVCLLHSILLQP
jgi:hypothetical protein